MDNLVPFLADAVRRVIPFNKVISHLHVREMPDGHVITNAPSVDGSIVLTSRSKEPIDMGGAAACLGNLNYLHTLFRSSLMTSQAKLDLNTTEGRNGKQVVKSIGIRPKDRVEMLYIASDPFRESIIKATSVNISEWPVAFRMSEEAMDDFSQIKAIHAAAPSTGNEDIIKLNYRDDRVRLSFGSDTHTSDVDLDVDILAESSKTISLNIPSVLLQHALTQPLQGQTDPEVFVQLSELAMKVVSENNTGEHEFTLFSRKMRDS